MKKFRLDKKIQIVNRGNKNMIADGGIILQSNVCREHNVEKSIEFFLANTGIQRKRDTSERVLSIAAVTVKVATPWHL